MTKLVDTRDSYYKVMGCSKGNFRSRTLLIKQFDEIFELQGKLSVIMYMFSIAEPGPNQPEGEIETISLNNMC